MTEQHPLTDEICNEIEVSMIYLTDGIFGITYRFPDTHDRIRAGADWQLEQVIEWLKATKSTVKLCPSVLADQLKVAMRPQQQENN